MRMSCECIKDCCDKLKEENGEEEEEDDEEEMEDPHAPDDLDMNMCQIPCNVGGGGGGPFNPDDPQPDDSLEFMLPIVVPLFPPSSDEEEEEEEEDDNNTEATEDITETEEDPTEFDDPDIQIEDPTDPNIPGFNDPNCYDEDGNKIPCPCYDEDGNEVPCEPDVTDSTDFPPDDDDDEPMPDVPIGVDIDPNNIIYPDDDPEEDPSHKRCRESGMLNAWDENGWWGCYPPEDIVDPDDLNVVSGMDPCDDIGGKKIYDSNGKYVGCYKKPRVEEEKDDPPEDPPEDPPQQTDPIFLYNPPEEDPPEDPPEEPPIDDPPEEPPEDPPEDPPIDDPPEEPPQDPPEDTPSTTVDPNGIKPPFSLPLDPVEECKDDNKKADDIFRIANKYRVQNRLPPLLRDKRLDAAAYERAAKNRAQNNTPLHDDNKNQLIARVKRYGYNSNNVWENVNYVTDTPDDTVSAPLRTVIVGAGSWAKDEDPGLNHNDILLMSKKGADNPRRAGVAYICGNAVWLIAATPEGEEDRESYEQEDPSFAMEPPTQIGNTTNHSFFNMRIESKRIGFVVDKSGSMFMGQPYPWYVVKYQLLQLVKNMAPDVEVRVWLFDGALFSVTPYYKAENWYDLWLYLQSIVPGTFAVPGTDFTEALKKALASVVTDVVLMFDGQCWEGDKERTCPSADVINSWNGNPNSASAAARKKKTIHTMLVKNIQYKPWMEKVSAPTGGESKFVDKFGDFIEYS